MNRFKLSHLSDAALLSNTDALISRDRQTTAELLAHLAEVDERRLYLQAAFPSMYAWCAHKLHLTEDAALKRIQAARAARKYPMIFAALADGRLTLGAVCLLAPHFAFVKPDELLASAAYKTKAQIEQLLVERFPRTEFLPLVEAVGAASSVNRGANLAGAVVGGVGESSRGSVDAAIPNAVPTRESMSPASASCESPVPTTLPASAPLESAHPAAPPASTAPEFRQPAPGHVQNTNETAKVVPTAAERFALHLSIGGETHADLMYAQELLSHQLTPGDLAGVIGRALKALIREAEKAKFAATDRPQGVARETRSQRHIPNRVKREVWKRDGGRCTFISPDGRRCEERTRLEFDHVKEVARGGRASVDGIRLRCHPHNQYTAEQTFGREFMEEKRKKAWANRAHWQG